MHRKITYVLTDEKSIGEAIKGFVYSYLDLEDNSYKITDEIRNKFREKIDNPYDFLAWISYQLEFMDIDWKLKFKFFQKFIEFLGTEISIEELNI